MTDTINRGYPYPRLRGDGADVSYWLQRLAETLDLDVQELADRLTQRTTAVQHTITPAVGWRNVSTPLLAARAGDLVVVTGRVQRISGDSFFLARGLPTELRPHYISYATSSGENSGNQVGPTYQVSVNTDGDIVVSARNGGESWLTSTWIPINLTYMATPAA